MKFSDMPYTRINYEEVEKQFKQLILDLKAAKSGEEQFQIHKRYYGLIDKTQTLTTLAHIRHDIDTKDSFYETEQNYYDEMMPLIENLSLDYCRELFQSPYRTYLEEKIGTVAFKNIEIKLKSLSEKIIPLCQEENALVTKYMDLIAAAEIPFQGEVLNLSLLRKYLTAQDRSVRQKAWDAMSQYFSGVTGEIDSIFDALVKNRTKQAKELGYTNYVELGYYRMNRNSYDKDMVQNFREQVKKYLVPLAEKFHEERRIRLGLPSLSYIDNEIFFPDGNPTPLGTPEEILEEGHKMYADLSPETKEFFEFMQEHQLFDVFGRKTKRAGGYMTYLPDYKAPFIFANFNGTSGDVDVITHECGHAFQGYLIRNEEIQEYRDITMETAEIHSMAMEFFTGKYMKQFFGARSEDYRTMQLAESVTFIPYGCMVDEYQHIVYEHPDMTPAERKAAWTKLEKEYKPHLDFGSDGFFANGGFWQKQQHIFAYPFYYIDYCLASICALQYNIKMTENYSAAWDSYLNLCKLSAKKFYVPMLLDAGLVSPFEEGSIEKLAKEIETNHF